MVAPAAILGAVAITNVLSGLAQAHQQKQAIKGQENELKRIKAIFDAIKPPELDIEIDDPPDMIANSVPPVDYDWSGITPEAFEVIGEYTPELAPYVAEKAPQLIRDTGIGREGLEAQRAALQRFQDISAGGIDPQFAQRMKDAETASQIAAQSRQESLLQDYARRGLLGSGTQLASDIGAAEGAMQRGAQMSSDAATQAYLNQLSALRDSANLGGQIRGTELDTAARNAQIANNFNQRTTAAFQNFLQNQANLRNEAALRNLTRKETVADANVENRNRAQRENLTREDALRESYRRQQQQNIAGVNEAALQNWKNQMDKIQFGNAAKQQMFQNELAKAQGATGQARDMAAVIGQRGQRDADVISGLGQAATQGILTGADYQQRQQDRLLEAQEREKDRELMKSIWGK